MSDNMTALTVIGILKSRLVGTHVHVYIDVETMRCSLYKENGVADQRVELWLVTGVEYVDAGVGEYSLMSDDGYYQLVFENGSRTPIWDGVAWEWS
jgi:hypothetical protein